MQRLLRGRMTGYLQVGFRLGLWFGQQPDPAPEASVERPPEQGSEAESCVQLGLAGAAGEDGPANPQHEAGQLWLREVR